jgi:heme/copper-type cytochrome/quinol oxidase subunit 3
LVAVPLLSLRAVQSVVQKRTVEAIMRVRYRAYFVAILGFWKVLGEIALLAPRLPLLKEWAHDGAFFDLTGATASHVASGHVVVTVVLAALAGSRGRYGRQAARWKFSSPFAPLRRKKET